MLVSISKFYAFSFPHKRKVEQFKLKQYTMIVDLNISYFASVISKGLKNLIYEIFVLGYNSNF